MRWPTQFKKQFKHLLVSTSIANPFKSRFCFPSICSVLAANSPLSAFKSSFYGYLWLKAITMKDDK
ncbi:MAG: hypothetical protein KBD89_03260 [Psychrobacter sp.]|uniref:hypothetical protein n=1 Tax=uncultured Psychrobacter sp. TaxID=259303 RepID=UPI001B73E405|nr:hypothetical protein [uncultured Psychrobacter sp.]MBP8046710.1 hypothetical protein [Psychrobacter sp.]MBP9646869.1 hypothetical protein [Psychrobacter sp.]